MAMKKFRCKVCGYIHYGDEPPEKCPVCKVKKVHFVEIQTTNLDKLFEKL